MITSFEYTVEELPATWPGKPTPVGARRPSRFRVVWTRTLDMLAREIRRLQGRNARFAAHVTSSDLRVDGQLRANAQFRSPAAIVSFDTPHRGRLVFPCDTFTVWQANCHAIARALEALRLLDRYGVHTGAQYTGFKALPASTAPTMSAHAAAEIIARVHPAFLSEQILAERGVAREACRWARATTHPDAAGEIEAWYLLETARAVLEAHFGGPL